MVSVLHIWNTAGVASTIAKWQSMVLGWRTDVLARRTFDRFGLTIYGVRSLLPSPGFVGRALLEARFYEIVHVHSLDGIIPYIRRLYPDKVTILHYHGSDIRGRWHDRERLWSHADAILVSTEDLLDGAPKHAIHVPNPVDTSLFRRICKAVPSSALFLYDPLEEKYVASLGWAREMASRLGAKLIVYDRSRYPLLYKDMPRLLCRFEYFMDHSFVPALSKTALEALACGTKVVRWDGTVLEGLPHDHTPGRVLRLITGIYLKAAGRRLKPRHDYIGDMSSKDRSMISVTG